MQAKLVGNSAAGSTLLGQLEAVERQIAALAEKLPDVKTVLEKCAITKSQSEGNLRAHVVVVKKSLSAGNAHVKRLERECAAEIEKRQQLLAKRRGTSQTENLQFVEGEEQLQNLQSKKAAVTEELDEWHGLATEAAMELKAAHADLALQSAL